MSLRAFHIIFILASIVLSVGFGVWEMGQRQSTGGTPLNWISIVSFATGLALSFYLFWFIRKLKRSNPS